MTIQNKAPILYLNLGIDFFKIDFLYYFTILIIYLLLAVIIKNLLLNKKSAYNHFFFFFFFVYTMKGFDGSDFSGNIDWSSLYSSSGTHKPIDNDLTSIPTLFLANFYLILTTSSNWWILSFDLLWFLIIYERPLFLDEYWHKDWLTSLYSY